MRAVPGRRREGVSVARLHISRIWCSGLAANCTDGHEFNVDVGGAFVVSGPSEIQNATGGGLNPTAGIGFTLQLAGVAHEPAEDVGAHQGATEPRLEHADCKYGNASAYLRVCLLYFDGGTREPVLHQAQARDAGGS